MGGGGVVGGEGEVGVGGRKGRWEGQWKVGGRSGRGRGSGRWEGGVGKSWGGVEGDCDATGQYKGHSI